MPTDQEIFECVRQAITEMRPDLASQLTLDSKLGAELGLESLDYMELEFQLETTFGIEFYHGSAIEKLSELLAPRQLEDNGLLTEDGAAVLRLRLPEVDPDRLVSGLPVAGIEAKFTPRTWIRVVHELLQARPPRCGSCGSERLDVLKPSVLRCASCGTELRSPAGDECLTMWASTVRGQLEQPLEARAG
jgi:acyl carrier protein